MRAKNCVSWRQYPSHTASGTVDATQMTLLNEESSPAVEALEALDPDSLSPRQALEWIYRLKKYGLTLRQIAGIKKR